MECVRGDLTCIGRAFVGSAGLSGFHAWPCVLRISLQCGDQCREVMEALRGRMCRGCGIGELDLTLNTRILPSGYVEPVASRSGCHGHHANAC